MACTRLPCDKKCPKTLSCGHPCPSVCGEPCERQTCTSCSEEDTLDFVVDLLGKIHLRDLEEDATLDSMTITLPCRHVFTVAALDDIAHMTHFYERNHLGEWTKAIMPDASVERNRPTCPRCGGGIDSLRYGRILKNSNHNILQHNIAYSFSSQLYNAEELLSKARGGLDQAVAEAVRSLGTMGLPSATTRRMLLERVNATLAADRDSPTNLDIIENLSQFHGFPPRYTKTWRKAVSEIMEPYKIACRVDREPDPSVQAYEDSLTRLYITELTTSGGSASSTTDPEQQRLQLLAAKVAHTRIGHFRPRASDRFTVEALWVTIEILILLGLAVSKACEEVLQQNLPGANVTQWENIAEFLLLRASADAETAYRLADQSKSRTKAILCRLLILQTQYEHTAHRCRLSRICLQILQEGDPRPHEVLDEEEEMRMRIGVPPARPILEVIYILVILGDLETKSHLGANRPPPVPTEVCRDFQRGNCPRGDTCRFSHTQAQAGSSAVPPAQQAFRDASSQPGNTGNSNFPGLSNDNFAVAGTNQTPGQTHHFLKLYVEDSFRFSTTAQVYRFVNLLCNASSRNSSWTLEEGQNHLYELVKGNGILRLGDAIRFPAGTKNPWSFQKGYIPILTYLSSDWVTKSRINTEVNALYGLVHNEFPVIRDTILANMQRLMAARNFSEAGSTLSGKQVFKVIFVTLFEYLTRYKDATIKHPDLRDTAEQIARWFDEWVAALRSSPPFNDECTTYDEDKRQLIISNIRADKERVLHIVRRERVLFVHRQERPTRQGSTTEGLIASLQRNCDYDGPGERRELGPRHDNDKVSIADIRVAPTNNELVCQDDPFLPGNFAEAPHFYDSKSVERLVDVQFRLLREELIAPIRMATQLILSDLSKAENATTLLSKLINDGGGRYRAPANVQESVIFSVFTNVTFQPLTLGNRGTSVGIEFDAPPGKARDKQVQARVDYWEQVSKKRLMLGGLVALIWKDQSGSVDIYVGTVASTPRDLAEAAKKSSDRVALRVSFFDAAAELRIVESLQNQRENNGTKILIEAPVFYEGIRPFLEALKVDPERLPFAQYLVHQSETELKQTMIAAPLYSRTPGFSFELKDLFPASAGVPTLRMVTTNRDSVANARTQLVRRSRLDPSQAEAVVDSLTREVALIQGPPGTGKSYTGLELIRVLIKNQISPILLVAYTNHALDHMLKGILDADITKNIIRLGSRAAVDERLASFSLDEAEKISTKSRLDRNINAAYREMRAAETEMTGLMDKITKRHVPQEHMEECILSLYPYHYEELFSNMPSWISTLITNAVEEAEEWETVGK
ncbi:unnamed protein product, partial [Rhizoctonia solani]